MEVDNFLCQWERRSSFCFQPCSKVEDTVISIAYDPKEWVLDYRNDNLTIESEHYQRALREIARSVGINVNEVELLSMYRTE